MIKLLEGEVLFHTDSDKICVGTSISFTIDGIIVYIRNKAKFYDYGKISICHDNDDEDIYSRPLLSEQDLNDFRQEIQDIL